MMQRSPEASSRLGLVCITPALVAARGRQTIGADMTAAMRYASSRIAQPFCRLVVHEQSEQSRRTNLVVGRWARVDAALSQASLAVRRLSAGSTLETRDPRPRRHQAGTRDAIGDAASRHTASRRARSLAVSERCRSVSATLASSQRPHHLRRGLASPRTGVTAAIAPDIAAIARARPPARCPDAVHRRRR